LIESQYGDGKFKKTALSDALNGDADFVAIVQKVLANPMSPKRIEPSDTTKLLAMNPCVEDVIIHLVEKRGFYFHGNLKRPDAWRPDEQDCTEHLALLAVQIAQEIAHSAADPIFDPKFESRHFDEAMDAGAKIVFEIKFSFHEPDEQFSRDGTLLINKPGTKVTGKSANAVAQHFLQHFEYNAPVAALEQASCVVQGSNQKVFDIVFHAK
jgi:hypothetical protein